MKYKTISDLEKIYLEMKTSKIFKTITNEELLKISFLLLKHEYICLRDKQMRDDFVNFKGIEEDNEQH